MEIEINVINNKMFTKKEKNIQKRDPPPPNFRGEETMTVGSTKAFHKRVFN